MRRRLIDIRYVLAFIIVCVGTIIYNTTVMAAYSYTVTSGNLKVGYNNNFAPCDGNAHQIEYTIISQEEGTLTESYTYIDENTSKKVTTSVKPAFSKLGKHSVDVELRQGSGGIYGGAKTVDFTVNMTIYSIIKPPSNLTVKVYGQSVEYSWDPVPGASQYCLWYGYSGYVVIPASENSIILDNFSPNISESADICSCEVITTGPFDPVESFYHGAYSDPVKYTTGTNIPVKVTYDCTGGSVTPSSDSVLMNSELTSLPTPTRTDYVFDGWFTAASGGTQIATPVTIRQATTMYAHWTKNDTVNVSFNANGGKCSTSKVVCESDDTLTSLPTPTRSGYTFAGWYTEAKGGTKVTDSTTISGSMTLYAHWNKTTKKAKLSSKSVKLLKGQKVTLKLNGASGSVKWKSGNKKIATVKKGKVTAKKKGKTTITATYKGKTYKCKVKVEAPKLSTSKLSIGNGSTSTLKLKGTSYKVKYRSDNKKVAKVNSKGVITAVSVGTTNVKAYANGKSYSCKVTVTKPNSSNIVTCPTCGGSGTVTCGTCHGNKTITRTHYNMKTMKSETKKEGCSNCGGKGSVTCGTCHGNKVIKR